MSHFPDDDSSILEAVIFSGVQPNMPPLRAEAPRGRLVAGADEVIMEGGVLVTSEKTEKTEKYQPLRLSTPTLNIFPDKNLLQSNEGIRLESPTGELTASTMELNSLTRQVRLERGRVTYQQPQTKLR